MKNRERDLDTLQKIKTRVSTELFRIVKQRGSLARIQRLQRRITTINSEIEGWVN